MILCVRYLWFFVDKCEMGGFWSLEEVLGGGIEGYYVLWVMIVLYGKSVLRILCWDVCKRFINEYNIKFIVYLF